jgi:hypothetical protein
VWKYPKLVKQQENNALNYMIGGWRQVSGVCRVTKIPTRALLRTKSDRHVHSANKNMALEHKNEHCVQSYLGFRRDFDANYKRLGRRNLPSVRQCCSSGRNGDNVGRMLLVLRPVHFATTAARDSTTKLAGKCPKSKSRTYVYISKARTRKMERYARFSAVKLVLQVDAPKYRYFIDTGFFVKFSGILG